MVEDLVKKHLVGPRPRKLIRGTVHAALENTGYGVSETTHPYSLERVPTY